MSLSITVCSLSVTKSVNYKWMEHYNIVFCRSHWSIPTAVRRERVLHGPVWTHHHAQADVQGGGQQGRRLLKTLTKCCLSSRVKGVKPLAMTRWSELGSSTLLGAVIFCNHRKTDGIHGNYYLKRKMKYWMENQRNSCFAEKFPLHERQKIWNLLYSSDFVTIKTTLDW